LQLTTDDGQLTVLVNGQFFESEWLPCPGYTHQSEVPVGREATKAQVSSQALRTAANVREDILDAGRNTR